MKLLIRVLLISLLLSGVAFGELQGLYVEKDFQTLENKEELAEELYPVFDNADLVFSNAELGINLDTTPPPLIEICNPEQKCATIDFSGDKVVYSGELPVGESAKLFFEYFGGLCPKELSK